MLVLLTYTTRQLQLGQIASIAMKSETIVLLLQWGKTASWMPELGVPISSFAKILTSLMIMLHFLSSFFFELVEELVLDAMTWLSNDVMDMAGVEGIWVNRVDDLHFLQSEDVDGIPPPIQCRSKLKASFFLTLILLHCTVCISYNPLVTMVIGF